MADEIAAQAPHGSTWCVEHGCLDGCPPRRITRNAARCKKCGDVLESRHRHDYRECSCGAIMVDGGLAYIRRGWHGDQGTSDDLIEELSEYADA